MLNRRRFLELSGLAPLLLSFRSRQPARQAANPIVISTWAQNVKANAAAWQVLGAGGTVLDALEAGVKVPEADPNDTSVGYGGLPDRDGKVTLDACIMDHEGNCGAVFCLEHIMHPISVARLVMEQTPHVQLAGAGALAFALSKGFRKQNLLTPSSEKAWRQWLKHSKYDPNRSIRELEQQAKPTSFNSSYPWPVAMLNHDTIGMLAIDAAGKMAGACSTSGMAFKMNGRVGDSPIIGAGLFVDAEVGAATCSGVGEEVVRICGSHTVVEAMRQGATPEQACKEAIGRIARRFDQKKSDWQVGFIALHKNGTVGAFSLRPGFSYAVQTGGSQEAVQAKSWFS